VRHELQDRADQLVGLQLFTRSLPIGAPLRELLVALATGIADLLVGVEVFVLILRRHLGGLEAEAAAEGRPEGPAPHFINLPWTDLYMLSNRAQPSADLLHAALYRLVMWTIEAGQALFFNPQGEYAAPEDLYYNEAGQALLVPLSSGEEALGAIFAVSRDPARHFDENDMVVVRTLANIAGAVVKLRIGGV
jgi:hypothetical protein